MKIGLISDTHNKLPDNLNHLFQDRDLIIHAGDIGSQQILNRLREIAPTKAVYGNTDIYSIATTLPSKLTLKIEGLTILVLHNIGNIKGFLWKIKRGDVQPTPQLIIFGHTHEPIFQKHGEIFFANPGSATLPRGGLPATIMLLEIQNAKINDQKTVKLNLKF